ncbi:GDNF-inducible zinc finger protein 1-like isoform X1 [Neocloeon triangulifer]|uniref:GDNF-inducible zinc finger protein 1-like isoform X1 n=1 Tax=Neocloeon triangulifer TaxID=2078957 RepID=UPI00286F6851|nr:GDNF-inducible zinc finger protein 1-like isoform X1 [Neocloeon triangulifer]
MASTEALLKKLAHALQNYFEKLSELEHSFDSSKLTQELEIMAMTIFCSSTINSARIFDTTKNFVSEMQLLVQTFYTRVDNKLEEFPKENFINDGTDTNERSVWKSDIAGDSDNSMDIDDPKPAVDYCVSKQKALKSALDSTHHYETRHQRMLRASQVKQTDNSKINGCSIITRKVRQVRETTPEPKEWPCSLCPRIFSDSEICNTHIKFAHGESSSSDLKTKLDKNSQMDKDSVDILCCCQCFHTYRITEEFNQHNCNLKPEDIQELDLPIKEGSDRLIRHWEKLITLSFLICGQCCEEYRSLERMICHLANCKPGPYSCEICKNSFDNKRLLNYHKKKTHRDTLSFFCDQCNARYKNRPSLQKHLVKKHEKIVDNFECDECPETFDKKILLTQHKERLHNLIKNYLCQVCGEGLSNPQSLKIHVARHVNKEKKFCCEHCDARFTRKDKLVFHTRTHTGEKPFECQVCSKKFIRKTKLDDHLRRHKGEKNHECDVCLKKFFGSQDLRAHQRRTHKSNSENIVEEKEDEADCDEDRATTVLDGGNKALDAASIKDVVPQENSQDVTIRDPVETLTLSSLESFIPSSQNIGPTQTILHTPTSLPMQILAPTGTTYQSQTTQFYQVPQTLQIQLPITVSGTSLDFVDLSQIGGQPIILTNFNVNPVNNLQF